METRFKIVLIGHEKVGKTSLLNRLLNEEYFISDYKPTVGADFVQKTHTLTTTKDNSKIDYEVWDTAGNFQFKTFSDLIFNNSQALLAVYDITNKESFEYLKKGLLNESNYKEKFLIILIGNKADLSEERQVEHDEAQSFAAENGFLFSEVSVKENSNLSQCFDLLSEELIKKHGLAFNNHCTRNSDTRSVHLPKINSSFSLVTRQNVTQSRCQIIDANSNSLLLSNISYHNKVHDAETRRIIADVIHLFASTSSLKTRCRGYRFGRYFIFLIRLLYGCR
jgi:small GTP-binding protein